MSYALWTVNGSDTVLVPAIVCRNAVRYPEQGTCRVLGDRVPVRHGPDILDVEVCPPSHKWLRPSSAALISTANEGHGFCVGEILSHQIGLTGMLMSGAHNHERIAAGK